MSRYGKIKIGVLALQGDFEAHLSRLSALGVFCHEVKKTSDLDDMAGLIIPGGETTTMNILLDRFDLREPLKRFVGSKPVWGTCAGMVMLAVRVVDNPSGIKPLGVLDIDVVRNGYGRQVHSFEGSINADLGGKDVRLTVDFIRAPKVARVGQAVKTMASHDDSPVLVSQGNILASSFHTELRSDTTLLEHFLTRILMDSDDK